MSRVLIVGASSGIGLALARSYVTDGYEVLNVSRRDCPDERVWNYRADVSVAEQRKGAVAYLKAHDMEPDVFVYSAGASMSAPVEFTQEEHIRYLWEVNYFAFVEMVKELLPGLRARRGQIAAISSMAAVAPIPFDAHYSASKAAIDAFLSVLDQEVAPYGVHVCAVMPGGTCTGFSFKRLVYDEAHCGPYYPEAQKATFTLGKMEQTGMSADKCAALIRRHLDKRSDLLYPVGFGNGATYCLNKLLPQGIQQATIRNLYATDKAD